MFKQSSISSPAEKSSATNVETLQAQHRNSNIHTQNFQSTSIQRKLTVGAVDDPLEDEADAMADKVMRMPEQNFIQRKCAHCEEEEKAQRKPLASFIQKKETTDNNIASDTTSNQIQSTKGSGNAMHATTKSFMESRFGADFSNVNIHTDNTAIQLSNQFNAQAFTVGNDIYFNEGKYQPGDNEGKHLLAHELTHVIQQNSLLGKIQRANYGGVTTGVPVDWDKKVAAATTSAQKAALIQSAVGSSVTIHDQTAQSSSDKVPDPQHLLPYTASAADVNFDDDLKSKSAKVGGRSLSQDAGYTLFHNNKNYVILSAAALDDKFFYTTLQTLNHEFDHVRQNNAGSTLKGNASELDAWTSSFIREFHRSYTIKESGGNCTIIQAPQYVPLLGYYMASGVDANDKTNAVKRIAAHYTSFLSHHIGHMNAFRLWILRSIKRSSPDLANDLNTNLNLNISGTNSIKAFGNFSCSNMGSLSFPSLAIDKPVFPASTSTTTKTTP